VQVIGVFDLMNLIAKEYDELLLFQLNRTFLEVLCYVFYLIFLV
jgi:hypothetical protein